MGGYVSIYRRFETMRLPSSDVYARIGASATAKPVGGDLPLSQEKDPGRLRKALPANAPLPRTLKWVASLPLSVKPAALLRHYPRIANVLAAAWGDQGAVTSYMDCLFDDGRENRKGFPADVHGDLLALQEYHAKLDGDDASTWEVLRKRG